MVRLHPGLPEWILGGNYSFFFFIFCCLIFLFRLRAHVFPESICLGAANYRGSFFFQKAPGKPSLHPKIKAPATSSERSGLVLRTDNTQPLPPSCGGLRIHHFSSSSTKRMRPREFFFPYHKANPNPNPSPLTLTVTLALNLPQRACALGNFPYHKAKLEPSSSYITLTLT